MVWLLPTKTQIVQHLDTYLSDPDPVVVAHAAKVATRGECEGCVAVLPCNPREL